MESVDYREIFRQDVESEVLLDRDFTVVDVSNRYEESTKRKRKDLIGKPLFEVFPNETAWTYMSVYLKEVLETKQTKRLHTFRYDIADIDGVFQPRFWRSYSIPIVQDENVRWINHRIEDVTSQVENNRMMEFTDRSDIYRLALDNVKDYAIFMLDANGLIRTWNTGVKRIFQYDAIEAIGKHFRQFYPEEDKKNKKPEWELETAEKEGKVEDENWRVRKDGTKFWANTIISSVRDETGELIGFAKITRDLTERRTAEQQTIQAYEESAKLKAEFLANMSHEIRTPMNGVMSAASLLKDTHLTQEQTELVNILMDSSQNMMKLTNDILDYSKLESDRIYTVMEPFDVCEEVAKVVELYQHTITKPVVLKLQIKLPTSCWVKGDRLRLHQVLSNLVDNAVKFTQEGYITVTVEQEESNGDRGEIEETGTFFLRFSVEDTGIGISESDLTHLFQPFSQLDAFATKRFKGSGLGLAICKRLVEMMQGTISVKSTLGKGTTFTFTVKVAPTQEEASVESISSIEKNAIQRGMLTMAEKDVSETVVLIAEDNVINQNIVKKILRRLGYTNLLLAQNGQEAIDMYKEKHPDIILMDIQMPVMDGLEATRQIRKLDAEVPIIAMTANALKGDAEKSLEAGMSGYIPKPLNIPILTKMLKGDDGAIASPQNPHA